MSQCHSKQFSSPCPVDRFFRPSLVALTPNREGTTSDLRASSAVTCHGGDSAPNPGGTFWFLFFFFSILFCLIKLVQQTEEGTRAGQQFNSNLVAANRVIMLRFLALSEFVHIRPSYLSLVVCRKFCQKVLQIQSSVLLQPWEENLFFLIKPNSENIILNCILEK